MKRISLRIIFAVICAVTLFYLYFTRNNINYEKVLIDRPQSLKTISSTVESTTQPIYISPTHRIVLSFVVCDSRFNESLNVVKSALFFTKYPIHFVIFTDDNLWKAFNKILNEWQKITQQQLTFELHMINFPEEHREDWLNLFSKCAAQRLFIPKLIPHISAMIYVDTDTLFLGPLEELWYNFYQFNSSQMTAMALEDDNPNISWYPRFAKHPFYGKYGLNSGVMLMNLTRMREFGWTDYVTPIMLKWKLYIPWGDQDIINIILHYHEKAVYVLSCRYNYRSDQCMYGDACSDATKKGIFLLHGSRKAFHNDKQPAFQAVYKAINEYQLGVDAPQLLLSNMKKYLSEAVLSNCGNLKQAFLTVPQRIIDWKIQQSARRPYHKGKNKR